MFQGVSIPKKLFSRLSSNIARMGVTLRSIHLQTVASGVASL